MPHPEALQKTSDDPAASPVLAVTSLTSLENTEYVGPIGVGTGALPAHCAGDSAARGGSVLQDKACKAQEESMLKVVFDTGSTNLWLASDLCNTMPCTDKGRRRYNHTASSTFQSGDPKTVDIEFGTAELVGRAGKDDFHIGPFVVKDQTFNMIAQAKGDTFANLPLEGIVGLAFPSMSVKGSTAFFDNVIEQKLLAHNEFAFFFSKDEKGSNAILWGGVDKSLYDGPMRMFPVSQAHYWALDLEYFKVGDEVIDIAHVDENQWDVSSMLSTERGRKAKVIVDTGTTYFTAEDAVYSKIMSKLQDGVECSKADSGPNLVFGLRDVAGATQELIVPASAYMVSSNGDHCTPAFMKLNVDKKYGPALLFGEVFMRQYVTAFDRGDGKDASARIGFAAAKSGASTETTLNTLIEHHESGSYAARQAAGAAFHAGGAADAVARQASASGLDAVLPPRGKEANIF